MKLLKLEILLPDLDQKTFNTYDKSMMTQGLGGWFMTWYQEKLRRTLLDMHIEAWDPAFLSQFSAQDYFQNLQTARINAPMIYIQSHVGLCYWPTESGKMHDALIGREDEMRQLFDLCHHDGMAVIAYYSLIYNNWAYEQHPEWRMRTADGKGSRENGSRYGLCCPNNLAYRDFVRAQMREFCAYFDFEGIFLDMTFWPMVCLCDQCRARWAREVGGEIPDRIDWQDPRWLRFHDIRHDWLGEFALDMTAEIKRHKPDCAVEHQYSTALHSWRFGVNENITLASDYAGGDLYGGIAQQSFACKLYYHLTRNQPFEYMTSRCYPSLGEHTSTKSDDLLRLGVFMTALHHGACLLIDAIDPVGSTDSRVYETFGRIFSESEPLEPWLSRGDLAYDVGVLFNLNGKMNNTDEAKTLLDPIVAKGDITHLQASLGAAKALREAKIPFTVLNNYRTDLIRQTRVLVVSDAPNLAPDVVAAIREAIAQGSKAYISGQSCWPLVEEICQLHLTGLSEESITYLAPTKLAGAPLDTILTSQHPLTVADKAVLASGEPVGTVLAELVLPFTVPGKPGRFASIHSNPPGPATGRPGLVRTPYGQGELIWSCVPFEKADRPQHQAIFADLIRQLSGDERLFACDGPAPVEVILFDAPEQQQKLLGLINLQETFATLPVYDFSVSVRTATQPRSVRSLPDQTDVAFTWSDGLVIIPIARLDCAQMLEIQL
jgi:hypothetical protein